MLPTVTIRADATIFNVEYCFPDHGLNDADGPSIVETCRLTLDQLGVAVLFADNSITTFVEDEQRLKDGSYEWLDHLVNYIIYKSRVNYRCYCNAFAEEVSTFVTCSEIDRALTFNLERLTAEQGIKKVGDRYVALGSEPCRLEIDRAEFDCFHKLIDRGLAVAITYFLVASENPLYFLVEYYKCLETVKRELGGERALLDLLQPHGFTQEMYKSLTRDANDHRTPIAFGRHAPRKGTHVIGIDLHSLQRPTMQRDLFGKATGICRACIDAYVSHLRGSD